MSKELSAAKLRSFLMKGAHAEEIAKVDAETDLFDEGLLDSFSVMQLVQGLEDELGIVFDYGDLRREYFSSLANISLLLEKKYGVRKV